MSLFSRFTPYAITRTVPGATPTASPTTTTLSGSGFIQPVSGRQSTAFEKTAEEYTHRLYTTVDANVIQGDIITQNGTEWVAVFTEQGAGISSVNHHKEVLLRFN